MKAASFKEYQLACKSVRTLAQYPSATIEPGSIFAVIEVEKYWLSGQKMHTMSVRLGVRHDHGMQYFHSPSEDRFWELV